MITKNNVMNRTNKLMKATFSIAALLTASIVSASDQALLDTLFENGVLNKLQYEKLSKQAEEKAIAEAAKTSNISPEMAKALDWASRVNITGDMRFRHENIDKDDANGVNESRQRIRARLKVAAKVNDEVDVGFRLVTAGGQTSANQTLEGSFVGKDIFFDRAYINWHPDSIKGLNALFGKFKQPWYNVSSDGLIYDSDVNPEGVALSYKTKVGEIALAATGGYFILEDGDTVSGKANNDGFGDDLNMWHAGVSASTQIDDSIKGTLGTNVYIYNNESAVGNFKDANAIELYEVASRFDFDTKFMPVYMYGQYVVNASADSGKDTAWLAGFGAKFGAFNMNYNYRDTKEFAVASTLNDSDFATGNTAARGHKVKLAYKISKNFSTGVAYMAAKEYNGINTDTLQLDLKAKF